MDYKKFKKSLLASDKDLAREYGKRDIILEISKAVIEARIFKGLTQVRLAKLMKVQQPAIARIENGNHLPSLSFLERMAIAMGARLEIPRFNFDYKDRGIIKLGASTKNAGNKIILANFWGANATCFPIQYLLKSNSRQEPINSNFQNS